jgi:cation:H+ antiporter
MEHIVLILLGIGLLTAGGEALIRGSLALAGRLGISPLLSGLLIVGFGTSTPELVVSLDAAISQKPDLAVGNVVGSNIANVLLVLGVCAAITPLAVKPMALRRDATVVVFASVLFLFLAYGGSLGRLEGSVCIACLCAYLLWAYRSERVHTTPGGEVLVAESQEFTRLPASLPLMVLVVLVGLGLLIGGSRALITGAVGAAASLGVSEAVIGLTLVAVGTSLPELAVGVMAALRRHADVAVGNILGSNIFNLLGILGIAAVVEPMAVNPRIVGFDQWVMVGAALVLAWLLRTGKRLSRKEGVLLLLGYAAYLWWGLSL